MGRENKEEALIEYISSFIINNTIIIQQRPIYNYFVLDLQQPIFNNDFDFNEFPDSIYEYMGLESNVIDTENKNMYLKLIFLTDNDIIYYDEVDHNHKYLTKNYLINFIENNFLETKREPHRPVGQTPRQFEQFKSNLKKQFID